MDRSGFIIALQAWLPWSCNIFHSRQAAGGTMHFFPFLHDHEPIGLLQRSYPVTNRNLLIQGFFIGASVRPGLRGCRKRATTRQGSKVSRSKKQDIR